MKVANILSGSRSYSMLVSGVLQAAAAVRHCDEAPQVFHLPLCRKWLDALKQQGYLRLAWMLAPISVWLIRCWSSSPTSLLTAWAYPAMAVSCFPRLALQSVCVSIVPSSLAPSLSHCALASSVFEHRRQHFCILFLVQL